MGNFNAGDGFIAFNYTLTKPYSYNAFVIHQKRTYYDNSKKRRVWVSLLLSLLTPGIGQLYNGQVKKALILYLITIVVAFSAGALLSSFYGLVFWILLVLCLYLFAMIDAIYHSIKLKSFSPTRYNRWYVYLLIIGINLVTNTWLRPIVVPFHAYKIASKGMHPSIEIGERIMVDKHWYHTNTPQHGDIVLFRYPADRSRSFIQRVIGLPQDTLEIRDKRVFINGQLLEESYVQHIDEDIWPGEQSPRDNLAPITIPVKAMFVMGDNRDSSLDSRFWQFVEFEDLQGKVLYIYWSLESNRIGKTVQ